jgi:TonB family protein
LGRIKGPTEVGTLTPVKSGHQPKLTVVNRSFIHSSCLIFAALGCVCVFAFAATSAAPNIRVAVLDFGDTPTGIKAAERVRQALRTDKLAGDSGVTLIDRNLAIAAARGNGYQGSLNLTTQEGRDVGAAIGCDFFIVGDSDTVRRSPSTGKVYFESYASIFIVSARTGRLINWQRIQERRDTPEEAESALLGNPGDLASGIRVSILRAAEDEAAERTAAVEDPPATIEVMSDDDNPRTDTRAPRPYRRVKPQYPAVAAQAEVEAVIDVQVDIDARGEVGRIEIARWAGYGLDQSVIDTVKQMHFFPAMRDGVAIPMRVLLRYNFRRPAPEPTSPDKPKPKIIIKPRP